MAVLIVVILHMHLAAGDQTLAVALATAGWALEERINHRHEITVFHTGKMGDFHITGFKYGDSHEWPLMESKVLPILSKLTFYNSDFNVGRHQFNGTQLLQLSPQSNPLWSRWIHRRDCYSFLFLEAWSGSHSTSHGPPAGCGQHTARLDVGGLPHMTYCTVVETRQRPVFHKDGKSYRSGNIPML